MASRGNQPCTCPQITSMLLYWRSDRHNSRNDTAFSTMYPTAPQPMSLPRKSTVHGKSPSDIRTVWIGVAETAAIASQTPTACQIRLEPKAIALARPSAPNAPATNAGLGSIKATFRSLPPNAQARVAPTNPPPAIATSYARILNPS
ncbi:MAG: hypothetical protein SNJ60_03380 [Pseudanabaenaceae cyanobacterium]